MNTKAAALIEHSDAETTQLLNEKEQKTEFSSSSSSLLTSRSKQTLAAVGFFAAVSSVAMIGGRGGPLSNAAASFSSLGQATTGAQKFTLHTGCSPLNKLPFDTTTDFTGRVGAKIVTKSMSNEFLFEKGIAMSETSCGNYEV